MWRFISLKKEISVDNKVLENIFTQIYTGFGWHMGDGESRSGFGSSNRYTSVFKKDLIHTLNEYNISSILDCSCGDWNWMRTISHEFKNYVGIDLVKPMIDDNIKNYENENVKFIHTDMISYMETLEDAEIDLTIIRHTLEHLPFSYAMKAVAEAKRVSRFSFITSYSENIMNHDLNFPDKTYRPISLINNPFVSILGEPIKLFYDGTEEPRYTSNYSMMFLYKN